MSRPPDDARVQDDVQTSERFVGARDLTRWATPVGRWLARWAHRLWQAAVRSAGWAAPRWVLLLTVVLGLCAAVLMGTGASEVNEAVTEGDGVAGLDRPLLAAAVGARSPGVTHLVQLYTDVGGPIGMPVLATVTAVGLALRWRSWTPLVLVAVTGAGSLLMTVVGKAAVGRSRPPLAEAIPPYEVSYSFPSGHSLNAMALAGIAAYLLVIRQRRRLTRVLTVALAIVFAVTMGLSRVYLGHHWLTDVVAAWMLALGWLALVVTGHRLWLTVRAASAGPSGDPR